ncbi:hypothetical protein R3I93_022482 [Phoxinus phoxinus]|uniref:Uncharacterized protein n=1 Tax=Phoxinus phoxinus TaxID=58324 RepID=A0AAN9C579_9TELE
MSFKGSLHWAGQNLRDPSCQVQKVKRTVRVTERSKTVLIVTSPSSKTADDHDICAKASRDAEPTAFLVEGRGRLTEMEVEGGKRGS